MIKNDFEKLNQDDWLAKEIARENRISAWDLDEGKSVREEHERDCDARNNADEHHRKHLRADAAGKRVAGKLSIWYSIDLVAAFAMFALNIFLPRASFWPSILLFLALNPGIFVWLLLLKRYPSAAYLRTVLFLAILFEIITLINNNYSSLRFLIWRLFR